MAMQDQDFWRRMGKAAPGLFDLGVGLYGMSAGNKEAKQRLATAQGPLYQQAMGASGQALTAAGSMDPKAAAAERYNAAQGLLAGQDAASEQQMMRMLQAKGMLGAANYNPGVEGIAPSNVAMNPQMAAFYAARNARNGRMAYDALNEGESQTDRMLARSGALQRQAAGTQEAGLRGQGTIPSRSKQTVELLKGAGGLLMKNPDVLKDIGGMLGRGFDWLGNTTGLWGQPQWFTSMSSDSIDW